MDLDFEKALTYIAKDPQWGNKLLAGAGLMLTSFAVFAVPALCLIIAPGVIAAITFFATLLLSMLIWIVISGYICETASKKINTPDDEILPDWKDFGKLFSLGFKYFLGYFLYFLPLCLIGLLFFVFISLGFYSSYSGLIGAGVFSFIFLTVFGAFLVFLYVLTMAFLPLMMTSFFKDEKILSFVNFKNAFNLLKNNVSNYLILILLFIAITILAQLVCSFLIATVIGIILLPIVYMYVYYVIADICAQFALTAQKNTAVEQSVENNENPSC